MKIQLDCITGGFSYGEIVEVGNGKGCISKKVAESLIEEGLAKEVNLKVSKDAKELLAENEKLVSENEKLVSENEKLTADVEKLTKEIATLKKGK